MLNEDIEDKMKILGSNIVSWRKLLGLTANQVAQRANISNVTYSHIENGRIGVSAGNLIKVMDALGIAERILESTDPYNSDLGRARADIKLPQRVRL